MCQVSKSDFIGCREGLAPHLQEALQLDVGMIDGVALVHILNLKKANTVIKTVKDDLQVFLPNIL